MTDTLDAAGLAPCPFCGGEAEVLEITEGDEVANIGGSVVTCRKCGASSPVHFDRKENLVDSWNRRATPSAATPAGGRVWAADRDMLAEAAADPTLSDGAVRSLCLAKVSAPSPDAIEWAKSVLAAPPVAPPAPTGDEIAGRKEWLIRKNGYFYRPNRSGYTMEKVAAGRYSKAEAEREASIEPANFTVLHESEVPDAVEVVDLKAELASLREETVKVLEPLAASKRGLEITIAQLDAARALLTKLKGATK